MAWTTVLVRYGEIGIKGAGVRATFERRLRENVEAQLLERGLQGLVTRERGRVYVETPEPDRVLDALAHTFGVVSASPAEPLPLEFQALTEEVGARMKGRIAPGSSFAVRARRTGSHPYTSMEIGKEAGAAVMRAHDGNLRVDLGKPDVEVHVEVRENRAWLFTRIVEGPGGLPLGTQGRVVAALENPRAVLAAWTTLRRGSSGVFFTWTSAWPDVEPHAQALQAWIPGLRIHRVKPPAEGPTRAAALAVARELARRRNAYAVVLGDGLAGFERLAPIDPAARVSVFRPLTGYPAPRLAEIARRADLPLPPDEQPIEPGEPMPPGWAREALRDAEEHAPERAA